MTTETSGAGTARFLEFFAGADRRTRGRGRWAAGGWAVGQLLGWSPLHVAAYIRIHPGSVPTVKQHLAAIRMLGGDWYCAAPPTLGKTRPHSWNGGGGSSMLLGDPIGGR